MDKIIWSRKRLRLYLALSRPTQANDIVAYANLSVLSEKYPEQSSRGDLALLKACQNILDENAVQVIAEKKTANTQLAKEFDSATSLAL